MYAIAISIIIRRIIRAFFIKGLQLTDLPFYLYVLIGMNQ